MKDLRVTDEKKDNLTWEAGKRIGRGTYGEVVCSDHPGWLLKRRPQKSFFKDISSEEQKEIYTSEMNILLAIKEKHTELKQEFKQQQQQGIYNFDTRRYLEGSTHIVKADNFDDEVLIRYIDGCTASNFLRNNADERVLDSNIASFLLQVFSTAEFLYKEQDIIHVDLSGENIMITQDGKVSVIDFGRVISAKGRDEAEVAENIRHVCCNILSFNLSEYPKSEIGRKLISICNFYGEIKSFDDFRSKLESMFLDLLVLAVNNSDKNLERVLVRTFDYKNSDVINDIISNNNHTESDLQKALENARNKIQKKGSDKIHNFMPETVKIIEQALAYKKEQSKEKYPIEETVCHQWDTYRAPEGEDYWRGQYNSNYHLTLEDEDMWYRLRDMV